MLYCDLWGCLHDGVRAFPAAVAALERLRARGGAVVLITNSPRPGGRGRAASSTRSARRAPATTWSSPPATRRRRRWRRASSGAGSTTSGRSATSPSSADAEGRPLDIERVPLEEAEGIVCTGLFDDRTETPDDYRATILYGKTKGLKLLCANPDIVVDVGDRRIYCAGAIAEAYAEAGGRSYYFGKPHPPIYALARRPAGRADRRTSRSRTRSSCLGDGIGTDILGAMGEGLDALFVTGGLAAEETGTTPTGGPDPARLAAYLARRSWRRSSRWPTCGSATADVRRAT